VSAGFHRHGYARMIDLYQIHDLNLISARLHELDLDLEPHRVELERLLDVGAAAGPALRRIESVLARLVTHDWPRPQDPVVHQLRSAAARMVERLRGLNDD
jgi:hypothetical protein